MTLPEYHPGRVGRNRPVLGSLLLLLALQASAMPVPVKIQAVLIVKILLFDRALPHDHSARFVIVYGDERADARELELALGAAGFAAKTVKVTDLEALTGAEAAVFFPHALGAEALLAAQRAKMLTFGSEPQMVQNGSVGVAVGESDGKPHIFVNLKVVHASGHDLASELLNLATVIR